MPEIAFVMTQLMLLYLYLQIRHFFQSKTVDIALISPQKYILRYSLEAPHCITPGKVLPDIFFYFS